MNALNSDEIRQFLESALEEDRACEDITVKLTVPDNLRAKAFIEARQDGVVAGINLCQQVFVLVDEKLEVAIDCQDGAHVRSGDVVARICGGAQGILRAERTALNILGWMSGIATLTAQFTERAEGTGAIICDTRKTTPTLRLLSKYAVRTGGGQNHRMNLADGVLIKDNHISVLRSSGKSLEEIVSIAREKAPKDVKIEIEVTSYEEALEVVRSKPDIILLDNMSLAEMKKTIGKIGAQVKLEASGGITLENVAEIAATGVDYISIGALTHSAKNMDFSLEISG